MPNITVVTTFHPAGMRTYGQRFLDSFAQRVDKRIKLLCYVEDCMPVNPDPRQIEIIDARTALPKLNAFKEKWKDTPKANGDVSNEPQRNTRRGDQTDQRLPHARIFHPYAAKGPLNSKTKNLKKTRCTQQPQVARLPIYSIHYTTL